MKKHINSVSKYGVVLLFALGTVFAYCHYFLNRAYVEVQVSTPIKTDFKMYWAGSNGQYSEKNMVRVAITPRIDRYTFFLTDLRKVKTLRVDPLARKGTVYLQDIKISQQGLPSIQLSGARGFAELIPLDGVLSTGYTPEGWKIQSSDGDPKFELQLHLPARALNWLAEGVRIFFLICPLFLLARILSSWWSNYTYTTYLGFFALALILTMAAVTKVDHHPDERVHYAATRYYQDHWLPPSVESPEILDSYSDFGISRLNTMEVSYFFAGKFGKLFELLHLNQVISYRMFNVALFAVLVFLTFGSTRYRLFFIPMLLSPQIWYIFSYMNSDAFSLFVVMLSGWQVVDNESAFNRFLARKKVALIKIIGVGFLLALLIFVKKNYYFFTLFLSCFFAWKLYFYPIHDKKILLKKLAVIMLLGALFAGGRFGADLYVNGFDKGEKIRNMQELTAKPMFKPSTPLEKKFGSILLKERGYKYLDILTVLRWGEKTFRSGFGAYGYMTAVACDSYYDIARSLGIICLLFMTLSIFFREERSGKVLLACALLCSLALIVKASHYAWTVDFQGQGRYFFPIVSIIGMVLVQTEKVYNQLALRTLCCLMFMLSVFSFVFIGIFSLAKYGWA